MTDERYLKLEVVWNDDYMFEMQVTCSNGRYCGATEVYETKEWLLPFVKSLEGYPSGDIELVHSCGEKDSYAFFQMRFYKMESSSLIGVELMLEENVQTEYRPEEKGKLKMELIVEPNSIDIFQAELKSLAIKEKGVARLIGVRGW